MAIIFPPMFTVLGVCFLLGLHRSKAVAGKSRITQATSYICLAAVVFLGLYRLNIAAQNKLSDSNTSLAKLVASFVGRDDHLSVIVPNDSKPDASKIQRGVHSNDIIRPILRFYKFEPLKNTDTKALGLNVFFRVDGSPAHHVKSLKMIAFRVFPGDEKEVSLEDSLFEQMLAKSGYGDIGDIPTGRELYVSALGEDPMSPEVLQQIRDKKVAVYFMGRFEYRGADNQQYHSDYCAFLMGDPPPIFGCKHHNTP